VRKACPPWWAAYMAKTGHGCDAELVFVREVQAVEQLISCAQFPHRDLFWMTIEDVQRHAAETASRRVGHLLQLVAGCGFAPGAVPRSPFVDHELQPSAPISTSPIHLQCPLMKDSMLSPSRSSSYQSTASS